jgi:hypothetical protein
MVRQSCSISEPNFDVSQDEMHKREREREREDKYSRYQIGTNSTEPNSNMY